MISEMEIPQPSSTREMSGLANLLPKAPTATMPSNFGSQKLPFGGNQFSQAMVQPTIPTSLAPYSLAFSNKHSMEVVIPPQKDHFPVSVHLGLQPSEQTSKFQSGMEPSPKVHNQASVNVGTTFTLASSKHQAHQFVGSHHLPSKSSAQAELPVKVQADFGSVRSKLRESLASALATGSKEPSKPKSPDKVHDNEEKILLSQAGVPSLLNEIHFSATDNSFCESLPNYLNANNQDKNFDENQELPDEVSSSRNIGDKKEEIICDIQEGQQNPDIVLDEVPFSHSIMEDELLRGHGLCWASDLTSVNVDSVLHSFPKRPKLAHVEENKDTKDRILQTSENLAVCIEAELFKLFGGVNKKYKEKGRSLLFNLKDPSNPELRERVLSGDVLPERLCSMSAEELASKELSQWRQAKAEEYAQMVMLPDMNIDIRRLVRKTHKGEFLVEVDQDDGAHSEVGLVSDVLSKILTKENEVDRGRSRSTETGLISSKTHDSEMSEELVSSEMSDLDDRKFSNNLDPRFPEKTEYTQEYIVEEMKDTELPPVVSLDEFMQGLDSEPPFENLEVDSLQENTSSVDKKLDILGSESILVSDVQGQKVDFTPDISTSKLAPVNILDSQSHSSHFHAMNNTEISSISSQVACKYQNTEDTMKIESDYNKKVVRIADSTPNCSDIWEGFLQLNVSALSNVVSSFLSGEKTSMQGWPNFLEVKGRVRLDAFEKFLQELPLSRSRAIMMVEFSWKENSMESGQLHLSEAVHSYITDERVGFAEPAPGVELYLCPPHPKITGMLAKHLSGDLLENARSVVDGLIGIVVWRRPHVLVSPRVSSHHKHGGAKRHSGSKRHQESRANSNPNSRGNPAPQQPDDADDVPPGFGPPIVREAADDLPEFDFSRGSRFAGAAAAASVPAPARPSSHVRELIQKYGQGGSNARELGIPVQPWNDEDDIPEWNPNQNAKQAHQMQPPPMPPQGYQQQHQQQQHQQHHHHHHQQPFMMNQQQMMPPAPQPVPHPMLPQNALQQPNAAWWPVAAQGMLPDGCGLIRPCLFGGQPGGARPAAAGPRMVQGFRRGSDGGLSYWRPDYSGSRGF